MPSTARRGVPAAVGAVVGALLLCPPPAEGGRWFGGGAGEDAEPEPRLIGWLGEVPRADGGGSGGARGAGKDAGPDTDGDGRWIEWLSWSPRASLYHGFLSEEEAEHIKALAEPKLKRSTVVDPNTGGEVTDTIRTSKGMFVPRDHDEVISAIERRVAEWSQVPQENQEDLQVLHYDVGEKYYDHWDWFETRGDTQKQYTKDGGNRVATVLMYLSDLEEGGETVFPKSKLWADPARQAPPARSFSKCARRGVAVKPKLGDALLFWDMDLLGRVDRDSMHCSCPVIRGVKWTATKWMHVNEFPRRAAKVGVPKCEDTQDECDGWARRGECTANAPFMLGDDGSLGACLRSCCVTAKTRSKEADEFCFVCDKPGAR